MSGSLRRRAWSLVTLAVVALAAAAAVRVAWRGGPLSPPGPPPSPPPPAAQPSPGPFGGPLRPAPLLSRGRRVASSPRGGEAVVDGIYRTEATWAGGHPTPEDPAWVAIEIGEGPTRLLLAWTSSGNHDWQDRMHGAAVDYRIETSADSTDGRDGRWWTAVEVKGNPVRTRVHAFDFGGHRWVRMVVTGLSPDVTRWGLRIDEIDVHDLSAGGDDVWLFLGDSITSAVFDRAPPHQPGFAEAIARRHPGFFPATIPAGKGRLHHADAPRLLEEALALVPEARVVALSFGSNDWDPAAFRKDLLACVRTVRAAGKIPVVPRIPFRSDAKEDFAARLNEVVDAVAAEEGLLPGPDLYAWFRAHPERLADGLHPDDAGAVEMLRLWAEAAGPLYEMR